ncbi:MAG: polyamine aminopropyltransferase [Alphaproteobacteria bacterium]
MSGERWFEETLHDDVRLSFRADEVLYEDRSEHQHLALIRNATFGEVLLLDKVTQVTLRDEFIYHEMLAHVPLLAHGAAREVLIVGGGDLGLAEEVLKHRGVARVTLVELDRAVVDFARDHFAAMNAAAFADARLDVVIADGCRFAAETERRFDVVLIDSTDPIGPGAVLFTEAFYRDLARILNPGGVVATQNGVPFLQPREFQMGLGNLKRVFEDATCYVIAVPTYFGGHMALGFAGAPTPRPDPATLERRFAAAAIATRYYTPEVHGAAFALPRFIRDLCDEA